MEKLILPVGFLWETDFILKVQDNPYPRFFRSDGAGHFTEMGTVPADTVPVSKDKPDKNIDSTVLRKEIEPWLTALFQSEHLSLLLGTGLTAGIAHIAQPEVEKTENIDASKDSKTAGMDCVKFAIYNDEINDFIKTSPEAKVRGTPNIEDQIRTANELLKGLRILHDSKADTLQKELARVLNEFAEKLLTTENKIVTGLEVDRDEAFGILVNFLMSFASRMGNRDRLNIFTTNYDRLIEAGSELAGIRLIDRFVGNLTPVFRSSRLDVDMHYNPPGIRGEPRYLEGVCRFTKLHGSVNWIQNGDEIRRVGIPFGVTDIKPFLNAPGLTATSADAFKLMIYPNEAKDRETAMYPYVELFRDFAAAVCRPNNTLVCYGYSFGDDHINRVIQDMLTIPSTHLVIIAFDDKPQRIIRAYNQFNRPSQMTLLLGHELGDIEKLTENYLPKSAIDKASSRLHEILRQRYGGSSDDDNKEKNPGGEK
ncbi:MAG: SIR2 family protein [Treponema sp.]|nr:SIR2 family protein [Treponema sp.]